MQNYTINSYQGNHNAASDLQNMENNFEVLRSTFAGTSSPANAVAGKTWFDTSSNKRLKVRNNANDDWLGIMTGTSAFKIWVYSNSAEDGWVIDISVSDKVLSLKGGGVYTTAGETFGSWSSSSHTLLQSQIPSHNHPLTTNGDHNHRLTTFDSVIHTGIGWGNNDAGSTYKTTSSDGDHTHTVGNMTGGDTSHIHAADANVRPTAAVGTLQYMNI